MANFETTNYAWPFPNHQGLQIPEIERTALAIKAIDGVVKGIETGLAGIIASFNTHSHSFESITGKPTTIAGYGIGDVYTKSQVDDAIANAKVEVKTSILGGAGAAFDTLIELQNALGGDANFATTTAAAIGGKLAKDQNLNDLPDKATARSNLGANNASNLNAGKVPGAVFDDASHGTRAGGNLHANATPTTAGFMPALDKEKLDSGFLSSFRNKIINGGFDVWQRGVSSNVPNTFLADRWMFGCNSTGGVGNNVYATRQGHDYGTSAVPGNPTYYHRIAIVSNSGDASNFVILRQKIEGVRTFAGRKVTLTFSAKADAPRSMIAELKQFFGTGGSPSAELLGIGTMKFNLTTSWQKFVMVVNIPSIAGKTLGLNLDDYLDLIFWLSSGSNWIGRIGNLGLQTGNFDISRVSLVEGDASNEADPFSPRHIQQELALCQRYYFTDVAIYGGVYGTSSFMVSKDLPVTMRANPTCTQWNGNGTFDSFRITPSRVSAYYTSINFGAPSLTMDAEIMS